MATNIFESKVIWAQIDANLHLRHSAYADFAAQARLELLDQSGLDFKTLASLKIGPVLFREELMYLKEVKMNDTIKIVTLVTKVRPDLSRWSFRHEMYRGDGVKAAIIHVDGAWIDIVQRKLVGLPDYLVERFSDFPKADDFQLENPA
jgi:acyl-CoA thioester hydrolase